MKVDVKGIVAILVVIGAFVLIGIPIWHGRAPDTASVGFGSGGMMLVLGFYFGHMNGAATQLANQTSLLASQAMAATLARRTGDGPVVAVVTPLVPPIVPPPA